MAARGARRTAKRARGRRESWVRRVAETSNAMDLPPGIFTRSPREIARGLKQSVLASRRTKGTKYQSAMSMLNLYINRTGKKLGARDRRRLEAAKDELRRAFGREPRAARAG
jgi:hypothetical protein